MTAAEVARQIGVRDTTIYDWLLGQARPAEPQRIAAFLDSVPREDGSGTGLRTPAYRVSVSMTTTGKVAFHLYIHCRRRSGDDDNLSYSDAPVPVDALIKKP